LSSTSPVERPRLEGLDARIADLVAPTLEGMGYELVRVQVSGKEKPVVQIMADRADGATFTVEDCTEISHAVGAVLDVAGAEPLPPASPLWGRPDVLLTPHVSATSPRRFWDRLLALFLDNWDRWRRGAPLRNVVDPAAGY